MMMIMKYSTLRPLLGVLLLLSVTEAFSRDSRRPLDLHRSVSLHKQQRKQNKNQFQQLDIRGCPTALQQASIAMPGEFPGDEPATTLLQKIINRLPSVPRGGDTTAEKAEGSFLKRHPFSSAVAITTVNAILADVLTQLVFESNPWNPKRTLVFGAFGFLYQGMVQYAIVNLVWEKVFPGTKLKAVIAKICAMNLFSDPLFFMPTFYIFKEMMTTGNLGWATIKTALFSYKANCLMDWRNSWLVWFPGHAVTYGVMPSHQRIPWMAFLSFFYMCILSVTRGGV